MPVLTHHTFGLDLSRRNIGCRSLSVEGSPMAGTFTVRENLSDHSVTREQGLSTRR